MSTPSLSPCRRVLLIGASGYVGGRLLTLLEKRDVTVRCVARRPEFLRPRVAPATEVVHGDVLSSLWLGLVTPVYARVGRKLIESIRHPSIVREADAGREYGIRPLGIRDAIARALRYEDQAMAQTRWHDALSSSGPAPVWGGLRFGERFVDSRTLRVELPAEVAFRPVERIGGKTGWYFGNWLWQIRGFLDLLVGGVGMRRGRPEGRPLRVGDALDFWRVESYEPGRHLRLCAEMEVPGRAWLQFDAEPDDTGTVLRQTATFDPSGLTGRLYWYALYLVHQFVFGGMLKRIARAARQSAD